MSLRELWDIRAAAYARRLEESERDTRLAWTTVAIWVQSHKPKGALKVPKLEDVLPKARKETDVETEATFMAQSLGVKLRPWKVKVRERR